MQSTTNVPRFLSTSLARALPVSLRPASPVQSTVELTLDRLLISPTAYPIDTNVRTIIKGVATLLSKGKSFKTEVPALRFDFPSSANGDNYFEATVGDIAAGRGRVIKEKDIQFTTNLEKGNIEFELRLSDGVRSLTGINSDRGVTQALVDESISGSLGIVPIRITNLFNNTVSVLRVAVNSDETKDTDFIRQLQNQGGVTVQS